MRSQVVCFLPCCANKNPSGKIEGSGLGLSKADLPTKWNQLNACRQRMRRYLNLNSPPTSAIHLYTGCLYNAINKNIVIQKIKAGHLRLIIISAGYGIVDAFEPIHEYDALMKGQTATYWRNCGLVDIISELLLNAKPLKIFGFFTGSAEWSAPGSKYRCFFTEGLKAAKRKGLRPRLSGCFYRQSGRGVRSILSALGRTFMDFINQNFNDQFVIDVQRKGRVYGNVMIKFEEI